MWNYYPKAALRPKPVVGKERMRFGATWWGKKWVSSVEGLGDPQRMSRGRAYARANQVFNIDITDGSLTAKVQGSRGNYNVSIGFQRLKDDEKSRLLQVLSDRPEMLGIVLNNELPEGIEEASDVSLMDADFYSKCSCPDGNNPCKHIAAVFYTLATEIDAAPQIFLKLRGIDRDEILGVASGSAGLIRKPSSAKKKTRCKGRKPQSTKNPSKSAVSPRKKQRRSNRE